MGSQPARPLLLHMQDARGNLIYSALLPFLELPPPNTPIYKIEESWR